MTACTLGDAAVAANPTELKRLVAPAAAITQPFEVGAVRQTVKFARVVVELPPEAWAHVEFVDPTGKGVIPSRYLSWEEGQKEVEPAAIASIFNEELRLAHALADAGDSLFSEESTATLQVGVRITDMKAKLCRGCGWYTPFNSWRGTVTMAAKWEVYSPLDRKVVATIGTAGGVATSGRAWVADANQLVNDAFRDNVRRLINSPAFRAAVTAPVGAAASPSVTPNLTPISLIGAASPRAIPEATRSVVTIFANEGTGSGFLVSQDGYILTNRHVVGGSKFVKVKWPDGFEGLGEVVRSDLRRDVALIKVDPRQLPPLSLRRSAVAQGDTVFAVGTPLDATLQNTVTRGIVSANRTIEGLPYIQSDVAINPGNSGGPLLDEKGAVVAVAVSGIRIGDAPAGLNFFIPIDEALKALGIQAAS